MVPFGATIAASSMIRRNRKSEEDNNKTYINMKIDDKTIETKYSLRENADLARAAYALIKICEKEGEIGRLKEFLEEEFSGKTNKE